MTYLSTLIVPFTLLSTWGLGSFYELWVFRWGVLLAVSVPTLIYSMTRKSSLSLLPISVWAVWSGLYSAYGPDRFSAGELFRSQLSMLSAMAVLEGFVLLIVIHEPRLLRVLLRQLPFACLLTAVSLFFPHMHAQTGLPENILFNNDSMAAVFVALTLPLAHISLVGRRRLQAAAWVGGVSAVLYTHTSTAAAVLGAMGLVYGLRMPWVRVKVALLLGVSVVVGLVRYPLHDWLQDNGRFHMWRALHKWWVVQPASAHWLGTGFGSGGSLLSSLPLDERETYFWAHNDWLQIGLELGYVGLFLALAAYLWLLVRLYRGGSVSGTAGLVGYGVAMCTNFPCHWALHALVGATYVGLASSLSNEVQLGRGGRL